jgi:hypothetical protein
VRLTYTDMMNCIPHRESTASEEKGNSFQGKGNKRDEIQHNQDPLLFFTLGRDHLTMTMLTILTMNFCVLLLID